MMWLMEALLPGVFDRAPGADLSVRVCREEREAEWRWFRTNELNRRRGCPCGRPAETNRAYEVAGTIPYLWWTCREHDGAMGFSSGPNGPIIALYEHIVPCPLGDQMGTIQQIGGPPERWLCSHREH